MNREEFIAATRIPGTRIRVDEVKIITPQRELTGRGVLVAQERRFEFTVTLPDGMEPPELRAGIFTKKDFWKMTGVIEDELSFFISALPPISRIENRNGRISVGFHTNAIELSPTGFDELSYEELESLLRSDEEAAEPSQKPKEQESKDKCTCSIEFSGFLRGFELIARNGGTEILEKNDFLGERKRSQLDTTFGVLSENLEFGLVKRTDGVEFHLRSRDGYSSDGKEHDIHVFDAFREAIGFLHGTHPWPETIQYRRDHRLLMDRIRTPEKLAVSPHKAFSERIWFNVQSGNISWDYTATLSLAFKFFRQDSSLNREIRQLLFLAREACRVGVHGRISCIAVCSLLESLVNAIWESAPGFVAPSRRPPAKERFQSVVDRLGLKWNNDWDGLFEFWRTNRNGLVHRCAESKIGDNGGNDISVESRIGGAINILILKLMGYSGIVCASVYEDKFKTI